MKKRIISLLLCLCMVFSLLPTAVLAADGEDSDASAGSGQVMQQDSEKPGNQEDLGDLKNSEDSDDLKDPEDSDDLNDSENQDDLNDPENPDDSDALQPLGEGLGSELSGSCGATTADTVSWALTENEDGSTYTLTISGNGAMKDYTSQAGETVANPTGWYALKGSITEIKIEEGVTGLGDWAFSYLTNVVKANIPASITSLGDHIFRGDTALTTVEWASDFKAPEITDTDSNSATYTGNYVPTSMFDGCTSLGSGKELSAWLPASFTGVGCAAFRGTQFTVNFAGWSNLTYIGAYGFAGMPNLDSFTLSNEIILGLRGNKDKASNAFNSSGLKSLTVADEITAIPIGMCDGCEQLSSVDLADSVTTIAMNAFRNTEALKEINLKNVQTINSYSFQGSGLTDLVLPESVKTVESRAFEACTSLTKVTINAADLTLDNSNTFAGCSSLNTVVTSADSKINGLNTGAFGPDSHGSYVQAPVESIEINGTVNTLNFSTLASLKDLTINGKNNLTSGALPSGFENLVINGDSWSVDHYQFQSGAHVKHLVVSAAKVSDNAGKTEAAFRSNFNLETAQFTGTTVKLQAKMFMGCTSLNWLDLSAVDTLTVGSGCFGDDTNPTYGASTENPNKFNKDCVIYAKDAAAAQTLRGSGSGLDKKGIVLIVNGGTVDVTAATAGFGAVSCEGFTAKWYEEGGTPVTGEPENGKTYYVQWTKGVFRGSCGATGNEDNVDWTLEYEGNDEFTLRITGTGAMEDYTCNITRSDATQPWRENETGVKPTAITKVVVGGSVTNIGAFACDGLSQVKEYDIAASVEEIGKWGVCGQNAEAYKLHDSTHYMVTEDGVLMSADGKTLVSYPGGKDAVDEYAIPNTVKTILPGAFVGIDAKKVVIPNSVTKFPSFSFGGSAVEEIEFNANVDKLERGAFSGLKNLNSFVFGSDTTVSIIDNEAFADLSNLTEITFPDSLTTIGDQAFKVLPGDGAAAPNLKKVTFGKGMSTIGSVVFLRQSALEVIDMTHCEQSKLTAVGEFNSHNYDDNVTHPYTTTPIVYTADEGVAELVRQENGNHLSYAVTNGGTFPADTVFEAGELAKPKKDDCLFLGWYKNADFSDGEVTTVEAGQTYYAKWMDHIPEPTDADFTKGSVFAQCLNSVACPTMEYGLTAAAQKYTKKQLSATKYSVTYDADAFAVNGHSLYSADKLNWTLTYDGSKWNLAPNTDVDDVVLVTHAPTTFDEVTKFIDGQTDVIKTSCVNGETTMCAYGLMVAFQNPGHVVSVEQEKGNDGEPIRGSYIATLQVDQFAAAGAKACNDKSFKDSPRDHDVRSQNPVRWRFQVRQAEVGTEKQYVWSAEPVTPGTDDVCTIAHNWVVTFNPANGEPAFTRPVKYEGKAAAPDPAPTKTGYTFDDWYLGEAEEPFSFDTTITSDITLTAKWTQNTYTVTFDPNSGSVDPTSKPVTFDEPYGELPVPTRTGYDFLGWFTAAEDGDQVTANTTVTATADHTLYAQWQKKTFTVKYYLPDETGAWVEKKMDTVDSVDYAAYILWTPNAEDGYEFSGWYQKTAEIGVKSKVEQLYMAKEWKLYGKFTPIEYNIQYVYNDGKATSTNPMTYTVESDTITLADATGADWGKTFLEWHDENDQKITAIPTGSTGDRVITAYWNWPVHLHYLDKDNNEIESATLYVSELEPGACVLPTGEKTGYDFDGWYEAKKDIGTASHKLNALSIAKKWELYGRYTAKTDVSYTVKYLREGDNKVLAPEKVVTDQTFDTEVTEQAADVVGYTPDAPSKTMILDEYNKVLTFSYSANTYRYEIHYFLQEPDGSYMEKEVDTTPTGVFDTTVTITPDPNRYGAHYSYNSVKSVVSGVVTVDDPATILKLNVYYDLDFHTLTFDTMGGSTIAPVKVRHGLTVAKPTDPTKDKYTFIGWYVDPEFSAEYDFATVLEADKTIYAKFELTATPIGDTYVRYDVLHIKQLPDGSYDLANAEVERLSAKKDTAVTAVVKDYSATHHINVNSTLSKLTDTAIQPYPGADGKPVYTILTVYYDLDFHTLTFDAKGGTETGSSIVRHGNTVAKPEDPKRSGYRFTGWFDDEKCKKAHDFDAPLEEDATVYAGWRKRSADSGVQTESPNKPKKDNSLKFNTEDHFAFVNGYPDGTVKPTGDVTRAEVAAILYRVMDADCVKTYETTRCSFSDVVRGDWFNLYVATLENAGVIVDTRTNGKFRPNEAITRAELAAMLAQFADIKSAANSFNDVSARHWASDEIAVCAKMGWINGYPDGSFRPDATITRAEMMAMINRALGRTPKSADDLLSGMKTWRDNANVNAWYYLDVQEATNSHTYTKSGSHETWKKLR